MKFFAAKNLRAPGHSPTSSASSHHAYLLQILRNVCFTVALNLNRPFSDNYRLTMRRAASSASGIASGFRTQIPRARVARSSITLTRLPQTVSLSWRGARSFASETDKPLSESASEVASEAANSLKGTAEATEQFSSEAAASAGETLNKGYDQAQATASSTAEQISSQAEGVASAVSSSEPASTAQSTPLHAEGVNTPPQEVQKSTLYVGNLYFEVTEKALGDEFGRFGEVIGTKIVYDGRGLSKGYVLKLYDGEAND